MYVLYIQAIYPHISTQCYILVKSITEQIMEDTKLLSREKQV